MNQSNDTGTPKDEMELAEQLALFELAKDNQTAWAALSRKERRIAIAKDVLLLLATENVCATKSSYTEGSNASPEERCSVCAIGAMYLSRLRRNVAPHKLRNLADRNRAASSRVALCDAFDDTVMKRIENVFMGRNFHQNTPMTAKEYAFVNAGNFFESSDERLVRIMTNIVENDGEFRP